MQRRAHRSAAKLGVCLRIDANASRKLVCPRPVINVDTVCPAQRATRALNLGSHVLERRLAVDRLAGDVGAAIKIAIAPRGEGILQPRHVRKEEEHSRGKLTWLHCDLRPAFGEQASGWSVEL